MAVRAFFRSPRPENWAPELLLERLAREDGGTFNIMEWIREVLAPAAKDAGIELEGPLFKKCAHQMYQDVQRWRRDVPGFGAKWAAVRERIPESHKPRIEERPGNEDVVARWIAAFVESGGNRVEAAKAVGLSPRTVQSRFEKSHPTYSEEWFQALQAAYEALNARDLSRYEAGIKAAEKDGDHRVVLQAIARRLEANHPDWKRRGVEVNLRHQHGVDDRTAALMEAQLAQQRHFQMRETRQRAIAAQSEGEVIDVEATVVGEEVM